MKLIPRFRTRTEVAFVGMVPYNIPKEGEIQDLAGKTMVTNFWNGKGFILKNFFLRRTTVNSDCYTETIRSLHACFCCLCPTRKVSEVLLLHDNARLHTNIYTTEAITDFG
jgi:hypothetical protein